MFLHNQCKEKHENQHYKSERLREAFSFLKGLSDLTNQHLSNTPAKSVTVEHDNNESKKLSIHEDCSSGQLPKPNSQKFHLVHSLSVTSAINIENEVKHGRSSTEHSLRNSFASAVYRSKSSVETSHEYQLNHIFKLANSDALTFDHRKLSKRRIVLTSYSQIPFLLLSIIPYEKKVHQDLRSSVAVHQSQHNPNTGKFIDNIEFSNDVKSEVSYSHLLLLENWKKELSESQEVINAIKETEHVVLDDPELTSGKHRTVLNLPSFVTSIIPYAKPSEVKRDINEQFKERHPNVTITLTKLRSIKAELLEIASKTNTDPVILAVSYFYFENVVLKTRITKQNRKYVAGACLLLSIKFFDDLQSKNIKFHIEVICDQLRLNPKDLLSCELQVLILLEFSLIAKFKDIHKSYSRLEMHL